MTILFNSIPTNIRTPGVFVEIDNSRAVTGLPGMPKRALLIGTLLASATVAAGTVQGITSVAQARTLFGDGSELHQMATAFRANNEYTELDAVATDTNTSIGDVLADLGDAWYTTIALADNAQASVTEVINWADERFGPTEMKDVNVFVAFSGTHAETTTHTANYNSPFLTVVPQMGSSTPVHELAAAFAAVDEEHGWEARPHNTLLVRGVAAPETAARYTDTERNLHLHNGVSSWFVDHGGAARVERLITTYQTNATGDADVSYLNVSTMRTLAYLRYSWRVKIASKYPRHKLANNGTKVGAGQAVVTPNLIRAEAFAMFDAWEAAGLVEDVATSKEQVVVERDETDRDTVNMILPPNIINQLLVTKASIQFRL